MTQSHLKTPHFFSNPEDYLHYPQFIGKENFNLSGIYEFICNSKK